MGGFAGYALQNFSAMKARGVEFEKEITSRLILPAGFLWAQALQLFRSTELRRGGNGPCGSSMEGEYRMHEHLRAAADSCLSRWRSTVTVAMSSIVCPAILLSDKVALPRQKDKEYPGGLSFTNDMGRANHFRAP